MKIFSWLFVLAVGVFSLQAQAQKIAAEPLIRKNLAARLPNMPTIQEVRATPIAGLYELRFGGADILYTDAKGDYLISGEMIDTKNRRNLTSAGAEKASTINFKTLSLRDAIVMKYGNGSRKLAVFEDPFCTYCRQFEASLTKAKNVTVYVFLYPILGKNSYEQSKNIWCAKDKAKAWQDWMLNKVAPAAAQCDTSAIARNVQFGHKHNINGTPGLIFPNGKHISGAADATMLEKLLSENQ